MKLSKYVKNIQPYRLTSSDIRKDVISGKKVLKLNWNESSLDIHGNYYNLYSPTNLVDYENIIKNELDVYQFESVLIYSGCDHAHLEACRIYLDSEKTVLIVGPTYDNFRVTAESFGASIIYYNGSFDRLERFIEENSVDFVYLCNPNNPTGTFSDVSSLVKKYESVLFWLDEAYIEYATKNYSEPLSNFDNILVFRTMSKAWALAGLRIGFILSSNRRRNELLRLYNPKFINSVALEYIAKLPSYKDKVWKGIHKVKSNRIVLLNSLSESYKCQHSEGNFIFITHENPTSLKNYLASFDIHVREFQDFHGLTGLRITVPTSQTDLEFLVGILNQYS